MIFGNKFEAFPGSNVVYPTWTMITLGLCLSKSLSIILSMSATFAPGLITHLFLVPQNTFPKSLNLEWHITRCPPLVLPSSLEAYMLNLFEILLDGGPRSFFFAPPLNFIQPSPSWLTSFCLLQTILFPSILQVPSSSFVETPTLSLTTDMGRQKQGLLSKVHSPARASSVCLALPSSHPCPLLLFLAL